jgi:hypothetical protein
MTLTVLAVAVRAGVGLPFLVTALAKLVSAPDHRRTSLEAYGVPEPLNTP